MEGPEFFTKVKYGDVVTIQHKDQEVYIFEDNGTNPIHEPYLENGRYTGILTKSESFDHVGWILLLPVDSEKKPFLVKITDLEDVV